MASFCHKRVSTPGKVTGCSALGACAVPEGRQLPVSRLSLRAHAMAGSVPTQPPSGCRDLRSQTRACRPHRVVDSMDLTDLSSANSKYLIGC